MNDYNFGLNLVTLLNSLAILDDHEIDSNQVEVEVVEENGQEGFATVEIQSLAKDAADTITALQQKLDVMAAENAALKTFINQSCYSYNGDGSDVSDSYVSASQSPFFPKNPATDTYLNSVRAEGVDIFEGWLRNSADIFDKNGRHEWADKNRVAADKAKEFADSLRSGSHDTADKAEGIEPASLTALPVERDQHGYWSHPDYLAFCDGRESIPEDEFDQWMEAKGLEWKVNYRDEEETDYDADGFDLSTWNPEAPAGEGWFVGSIHDTDDGAVCIWLRAKAGA